MSFLKNIHKNIIVWLVRVYQFFLSPDKNILVKIGAIQPRITCVFYPTCSEYMILAIEKYGVRKGIVKGIQRIGKCRKGTPLSVDMP